MKTVDKNINLSQAKKILKDYANKIVEILKRKGIRMVKEIGKHHCGDYFHWQSINKENCAKVTIDIAHEKDTNGYCVYATFVAKILYPDCSKKTPMEVLIMKKIENKIGDKYPLAANTSILVLVWVNEENPEMPILKPSGEVAKQLYLALKCYDKITSKIKTAERLNSLLFMRKINRIIKLTK